MFELFISKDALTKLYFDRATSPNDWLKVIGKQRTLFLMNSQGEIDVDISDSNSLLSLYMRANGKNKDIFEPSPITLSEIQSKHERVLENPCGCYLLDIDKTEAETIQKDFGVICQSTKDYQACPLTFEEFPISPKKNDTGYSWNRFSVTCSMIPSNAIIINDRNLLHAKTGKDLHGLSNIEEILQTILPVTLASTYHVGIIIGSESGKPIINSPHDYESIVTELERIKKRLNRPYTIIMSLLVVDNGDQTCWEKTHDRRIISNYYFFTADHKFAAFWNGKSTETQSINLIPDYCKGLVNGADAPVKDHQDKVDGYKYVISHWGSNPNNKYASGLNSKANIKNLQHRLLQ